MSRPCEVFVMGTELTGHMVRVFHLWQNLVLCQYHSAHPVQVAELPLNGESV